MKTLGSSRRDGGDLAAAGPTAAIGAVCYLNAKPLVWGLERIPGFEVRFAPPSLLASPLAVGELDAALTPVVDWGRRHRDWRIISDACIASDGETLTVRIFSQSPIEEIRELHCDADSHTSVVLARIILTEICGRQPEIMTLRSQESPGRNRQSVLLIGDKVAAIDSAQHPYRLDLGAAWKQMTGLPFVFAVWAGRTDRDHSGLSGVLESARDDGVANLEEIAESDGPRHGWPVDLARAYLTRHMKYRLDDRYRAGMVEFFDRAADLGIVDPIDSLSGGRS